MSRLTHAGLTATHWGNYYARKDENGNLRILPVDVDDEPSAIGQSLASIQDPRVRVAKPMVRLGYYKDRSRSDTTRRGKEPFVEVEWDEALAIAADALKAAKENGGNRGIYGGSYGWASAGRFHHAQSQVHRFLRTFGGYTDSVDTYSIAAAEVIVPHVLGMNAFVAGLESPTTQEVVEHCKRIVYFGGASTRNMQANPGGNGFHDANWHFDSIARAGIDVVNISPIRDDMRGTLKARWLPCRPNSDVAIMLGLLHTLIQDDLYDKDFVERYCVGFDKLADYVMGSLDGVPKDAAWAAGKSEIDAGEIKKLARLLSTERSLIAVSFAIQRAEHGEQTYWAAIALAAALGHMGLPGGGFLLGAGVGKMNTMQRRILPFSVGALPQGQNPVRDYIPLARVTEMLERPGGAFTYNGHNLLYPKIDLVYWVGGNPFHHHQDINRLRKAWANPKHVIVHEIAWTTTARFADIVLPCTAALEREDFAGGSLDNWLTPMQKVLEPYGESRSDYDIFTGIAEKLGLREEFTQGRSSDDWLHLLYDTTRTNASEVGIELPDFETFRDGPPIDLRPLFTDRELTIERFRAHPHAHPLATPSGKIELFSQKIADFGYADCVGHPAWFEKKEWLGNPLSKQYPFHLLSNQPYTRLHSQLDNGIVSQNSKVKEREPLRINPQDALAKGIKDGDLVRVFNSRGAFLAGAILSDALRPNVLQIATGAWYDFLDVEDPLSLEVHGNPNAVTNDIGTSSLAQGPSANSCLVDIEIYDKPRPPLNIFTPPKIIAKTDVDAGTAAAA